MTVTDRNVGYDGPILSQAFDVGHFPSAVNKEIAGIHVLLTQSLFAFDILRSFPRRVSLAKSISAPVRF
jgi:hypothetical protein